MTGVLRGLVVTLLLAAGAALSVVAYAATGGDAAFLRAQENARPARADDLEAVMLTTQEPYGAHERTAVAAGCRPGDRGGELQNPWRCELRYSSGRRASFRVILASDGAFRAVHREGTGSITGCCVDLSPAT